MVSHTWYSSLTSVPLNVVLSADSFGCRAVVEVASLGATATFDSFPVMPRREVVKRKNSAASRQQLVGCICMLLLSLWVIVGVYAGKGN